MPDKKAPSISSTSFENKMRFGSFEILAGPDGRQHLLGKGAFGRTYKARHIFLERTVALKIINDRFMSDPKARERFLGEARAAAKLQHPHIAQILDFGEADGMLFYAMEYCSGGDLADYVKRNGPLSIVQTVQIGLQVAAALQGAHGAGFIHRDLKPSNLMLASPDGPIVTKLIDFGLVMAAAGDENAEPIDPDEIPTIEQRFVGTPLFASPEQLLVQPLDIRSDFFSLGMTLWYLVLGAPPDPGNSSAVVAARLKEDSYAPRLPQKLPQAFQTVLARLLEKQPENRFANATQLIAALSKCAAGLGLPTGPVAAYSADEAGEAEEAGPPQAAAIERIGVPVEECFTLQGERGGSATGADFAARAIADQSSVWLHFLKPSLLANARTLERLRKNIGHLQRRPSPIVLAVSAMREHPDRTLVVLEAPAGGDLLTHCKASGALRLADARPLLQSVANACDTLLAAGLPAPELDLQRIFIRSTDAGTALGAAQVMPRFLSLNDVSSVEPIPPVPVEPGWQFAALIFRVLAGRAVPAAPEIPKAEGLKDEANRLLAQALSGQLVHATCSELLADLLIAEGLMGASITRTHATLSSTAAPSTTHGPESSAPSLPPPLPGSDDPLATASPPPRIAPPIVVPPASRPVVTRTAPRSPSVWPVLMAALLVLIIIAGAGTWLVYKWREGSSHGGFFASNSAVQLQGDLPSHATARVGPNDAAIEKDGDHWRTTFDGSKVPFPARLIVEATGFKKIEIELNSPADLTRAYDANMKRAEGTLVFDRRNGSDYDHAVLRMTAQLPEEQSFVELERFNRGIPFGTEPEAMLVTGIYQLTVRGADERIVRPRLFDRVVIKPGERTVFELPPSFAGQYSGSLTTQRNGRAEGDPARVELTIDLTLSTGNFMEPAKRGPRRLAIMEGRLDSEGTYAARIQSSVPGEGEATFDQILSLKRGDNGEIECEVSESADENPAVERRLNRQPFPKASYSLKGTLRQGK